MLKEKYFIYGRHAVVAALKNSNREIIEIFIKKTDYKLQKTIKIFLNETNRNNKIKFLDSKIIEKNFKYQIKHQGILVLAKKLYLEDFTQIFKNKNNKLLRYGVILDGLTDVNNVGAIYRSAKAFGIDFIINTKRNSVLETNSLLNTACGAFDALKTFTTNNIVNSLQKLKDNNWWVIGLDHLGNSSINKTIEKMNANDKFIFILGSEGKGIRKLIKRNCHFLSSIPTLPNTNSINVSNAAAITFHLLYQKSLRYKKVK